MSDSLQQLRRLIAGVLAGLLVAAGAEAQSGRQRGEYAPPPPPRQFADPDRAASAARKATGGRVLGVQGADQNGQPGYRVRILEPGGEPAF